MLDLDETLVHSTLDAFDKADFSFTVTFNGRAHGVNVRARPHLVPFLERCAALFEVVIFTASQKVYAEQLLNILDPTRCVQHFSRETLDTQRIGVVIPGRTLDLESLQPWS